MEVVVFKNADGKVSVLSVAEGIEFEDVTTGLTNWRIMFVSDLPKEPQEQWVWTETGDLDVATE